MQGVLNNKVAIITGVGGGIGLESMRLFLEQGATVLGADRSQRRLDEAAALLAPHAGRFELVCCDAAEESAVAGLVGEAQERFGGLHVAFANAGIGGYIEGPEAIDLAHFSETLRINLLGPVMLIKHAAPVMRAQKTGAILVTASIAGLRGRSAGIDYSASKAAVISVVQNSALSLGRDGVRVNAICPAGSDTPMTRRLFDALTGAFGGNPIAKINPMGRIGQPQDMANLALFLASDAAAYINGQAINVCGGLSASHPFAIEVPYP